MCDFAQGGADQLRIDIETDIIQNKLTLFIK